MRLFLLALLLLPLSARAEVTVFAAASLTDALRDVDTAWQAQGGTKLRMNFAASSTLARQIEQGAPANLFASADAQWMDWAQQRNLIVNDTRKTLLGNDLVLVMPKAKMHPVQIGLGWNLMELLGADGRLAVGDPGSVPAGIYARQALEHLDLWTVVQPRLAPSDSVRSALLLVERGEAPAGVVYATDAAVAPGVAIAGVFPDATHDPIIYPFAITRAGDTPEARKLLDFLASPTAMDLFRKRGFKAD